MGWGRMVKGWQEGVEINVDQQRVKVLNAVKIKRLVSKTNKISSKLNERLGKSVKVPQRNQR